MYNFNLGVIIFCTWQLKFTPRNPPNSKFRGNPGYLFQVVLSLGLGLGVRFVMINYTRITENTPFVKLPPKDSASASPCYLYPAFCDVGMSSLRKATALRRLFFCT